MAIEYQLKFAAGVELRELAETLRGAGFADTASPRTFQGEGVTATLGGDSDRFGRWQALGFAPQVEVFFGLDRMADEEEAIAAMVDAVAALLAAVPADAAMTHDNEIVLLLRQRGELVLTNRHDWWTRPAYHPALAQRLGEDYRLEPLPVI